MYDWLAEATDSCAWTTSRLLATPAASRSRACVSVWLARSTLLRATATSWFADVRFRNAVRTW